MPLGSHSPSPLSLVLIVSDQGDEAVTSLGANLAREGARVETVPHLYAATSRLAQDDSRQIQMVLVDERSGDRLERNFFRVVQTYHPGVVAACVATGPLPPNVNGDRRTAMSIEEVIARYRLMVPVAGAVVRQSANDDAPPLKAEPVVAPRVVNRGAPSDAVRPSPPRQVEPVLRPEPGLQPDGPSLHDAVRARMAADAGVAVARRTPPRAPAGAVRPSVEPPQPASLDEELAARRMAARTTTVTADELAALMETPENAGGGESSA